MRSLLTNEWRELAGCLPVHEHAVPHQVPAIRFDPLVIEAGCREASRLRPIADQIHDFRTEAKCPGVGGFDELVPAMFASQPSARSSSVE